MTREQLEHIIRAATTIAEDDDLIIIGSQSILGQFPAAPAPLLVSMEADVFPMRRPERAELIDGTIGEGSPFHATFGYYAQGVGEETAILPAGWKKRLVPIRSPATRGATGWALEVHDLLVAKYAAGREKDIVFVREAVGHGLAQEDELLARLDQTPISEERKRAIAMMIERHFDGRRPAR